MSEGSQNQQLDDRESAAMPVQECPLKPSTFFRSLRSKGLRFLEEIEVHISASKCHHPPLKDLTLHGSLDGSTPLLVACYFGDLECVKHIVSNWHVDIQAAGVYYDGFPPGCSIFKSASPLFVAAYNGHIDIVKYLVGLGADVSFKTSSETLPTPSRFEVQSARKRLLSSSKESRFRRFGKPPETIRHRDGLTSLQWAIHQFPDPAFLEIVCFLLESGADQAAFLSFGDPIWMDPSCGVDITTALIHHGLNLNQRNSSGETILHHWANHPLFDDQTDTTSVRAALDFIELIVNLGADLMARDNSGFTPLLTAASHCRYEVVDFLATRDYTGETGRMEMIDGMEMTAAEILWESSNGLNSEHERAFGYLRKALDLRQIGSLHMTPLKLKRGRTIGWTTAAQLDQVIEQPVEYTLQSYLIQLRICSGRSWQAVSSLACFLYNCTNRLKQQNRLDDLIDVLWATLEKIQLHSLDMHHGNILCIEDLVVQKLTRTLSQLERNDPLYNAETFKTILKALLMTDHARSIDIFRFWHMDTLLQVVTFLSGLPSVILNDTTDIPINSGGKAVEQEESKSVMELLRQLVDGDVRDRCRTLLHSASEEANLNLAAVKLLLEANADPNAGDRKGNGALHILALTHHGNSVVIESAARLLLKYGAHLDMVNQDKKTAAQIWKEKNVSQDLPLWLREPGTVPKLKCLSARFIRSNNIAFTKLPEILHPFVKWH